MATALRPPGPLPPVPHDDFVQRAQRVVLPALLAALVLAVLLAAAKLPAGSVVPGPLQSAVHGVQRDAAAPASTAEPASPAEPAGAPAGAGPRYWRVAPGESIQTVASRSGASVSAIERLNPSVDPDRLVPGRFLKLPR